MVSNPDDRAAFAQQPMHGCVWSPSPVDFADQRRSERCKSTRLGRISLRSPTRRGALAYHEGMNIILVKGSPIILGATPQGVDHSGCFVERYFSL
jgi:hypothetical protein